jgi:anthranilate synthase component 1
MSGAAVRTARPITRELLADSLTPLGVYRRLAASSPVRFLFESVTGGEQVARYSFMGASPTESYLLYQDRLEVERDGRRKVVEGEPLAALREQLGRLQTEQGRLPFAGGFVGYFGYDLVRLLERLPESPPDRLGLPVAQLARFDAVLVFDHARQRVIAVANEIDGEVSRGQAESRLEELADLLTRDVGGSAVDLPDRQTKKGVDATPSLGGEEFRDAVRRVKEYISAGDVFQVVLARRWRLGSALEPLALYRALRLVNPSPYMVLLEQPEVSLVGSSPEMLVRKTGRRVETRPIAGTRHRSLDPQEDRRLAEDLLSDAKERAEHVMLVDLGRNDLGRVAAPGSVRVASFMEVERYSHVMHIVSEVEGELATGRDALDALLACFPAGTVSGAPKIRAMQIIDELEPEARGPYAGAVGYLSYSGDLDTCITIRTLVVRRGEISVTAGAGIVADSVPAAEERETENKAAALLDTVELARLLEEDSA